MDPRRRGDRRQRHPRAPGRLAARRPTRVRHHQPRRPAADRRRREAVGSGHGTAGEHAMSIAFVPDQPDTVLVGVHGKVLRSHDRGGSWTPLATGSDDPVTAIASRPTTTGTAPSSWAPQTTGSARRSTTARRSPTPATGSPTTRPGALRCHRPSPRTRSSPGHHVGDGVFRTADGGGTWERAPGHHDQRDGRRARHRPLPQHHRLTGHGQRAAHAFVAGFDGLFRSRDGGSEWKEIQTEDATNIVAFDVSPDYARDRSIAVATYINGVSRSDDDGGHWTKLNVGSPTGTSSHVGPTTSRGS